MLGQLPSRTVALPTVASAVSTDRGCSICPCVPHPIIPSRPHHPVVQLSKFPAVPQVPPLHRSAKPPGSPAHSHHSRAFRFSYQSHRPATPLSLCPTVPLSHCPSVPLSARVVRPAGRSRRGVTGGVLSHLSTPSDDSRCRPTQDASRLASPCPASPRTRLASPARVPPHPGRVSPRQSVSRLASLCPASPGLCPASPGLCPTSLGHCPASPGLCPASPSHCPASLGRVSSRQAIYGVCRKLCRATPRCAMPLSALSRVNINHNVPNRAVASQVVPCQTKLRPCSTEPAARPVQSATADPQSDPGVASCGSIRRRPPSANSVPAAPTDCPAIERASPRTDWPFTSRPAVK